MFILETREGLQPVSVRLDSDEVSGGVRTPELRESEVRTEDRGQRTEEEM